MANFFSDIHPAEWLFPPVALVHGAGKYLSGAVGKPLKGYKAFGAGFGAGALGAAGVLGAGAGAGASEGGGGFMSFLGLGGEAAPVAGSTEASALAPSGGGYVAGAPQAGPYAPMANPTTAYIPEAAGPGPYALPGQEATAAELAPKPSFGQRLGSFSDAYGTARERSGGNAPPPRPPEIALPPPGPPQAPAGPIQLTPQQAAAILGAGRPVGSNLAPQLSQALLAGRLL